LFHRNLFFALDLQRGKNTYLAGLGFIVTAISGSLVRLNEEYLQEPMKRVILNSGNRNSGSCVVAKKVLLERSVVSIVLEKNP
jgi:hypothetical protein